MRVPRPLFLLAIFLCLAFPVSLAAQQTTSGTAPPSGSPPGGSVEPPWTPAPVRDAQAVSVVQAAINALGGVAAITQVQSCAVLAQFSSSNAQVTWQVAGAEFRADVSSPSGTSTIATGHGKPFTLAGGTAKAAPEQVTETYFIPPLVSSILLTEFQNANYSLEYAGTGTLGSSAVTIVKTSSQATEFDAVVTPQTWYFDSTTGLPLRVEYRLADLTNASHSLPGVVDFSDYRSVGGVSYPLQASWSINGDPPDTVTVTSVQPNAPVASSSFNAPAGGIAQ